MMSLMNLMLLLILADCYSRSSAHSVKMEIEECAIPQLLSVTSHLSVSAISCSLECQYHAECQMHYFNTSTGECRMSAVIRVLLMTTPDQCNTTVTVHVVAEYLKIFEARKKFIEIEVNSCFFANLTNFQSQTVRNIFECADLIRSKEEMFSFDNETSLCQMGTRPPSPQLCANCSSLEKQQKAYIELEQWGLVNVTVCSESVFDCKEMKVYSQNSLDGIYNLNIRGIRMEVFCDMESDEEQWIVMQRRINGTQPFNKLWDEYKNGFGNMSGEFWLGNEKLFQLTSAAAMKIRIDLWDKDDKHAYAEYSLFNISAESDKYKLRVSGYSGNAGDSLATKHNNMLFSAIDQDYDTSSWNCSDRSGGGGWWYNQCHDSNLNGKYFTPGVDGGYDALCWYHFSYYYSLKKTIMKIAYIN